MAKEDFEEDDFNEDEDEISFDDEEENPSRVETRGRPKRDNTINQIKQAVNKPSPVVKPRVEEETNEQLDVYAYNQPARIGIARRSTNKPLGENDELIVGALVEILNKLDRIEKNTG
jgi:hypothetical protein